MLAALLLAVLVVPPLAILLRDLWLQWRDRRRFLAATPAGDAVAAPQPSVRPRGVRDVARACPACGAQMKAYAGSCRHCGLRFDAQVRLAPASRRRLQRLSRA